MKKIINWEDIQVNGNRSGSKKTTCPNCSQDRRNKKDPCLSVDFEKGLANCHHCGAVSFKEQKKHISPYTPPPQNWQNFTSLSDAMVKYCSDRRKIPQRVLIEYRVTEEKAYIPQKQDVKTCIVFNYFEGDEVVNKKFRDGQKNFTQSKDGKKILYNIECAIGEKELYIVEGEFDVLAMASQGVKNVVSLVNGANDHDDQWINSEKYISDVEHFIIAVDNDEKGREVREKIAHRLGKWKCSYIEWTHKDANDSVIKGTFDEDIKSAKRFPVSGTFNAKDLEFGIFDLYKNGLPKTIKPKHRSFDGVNEIFSVMRGHLVTVTGIPSHGKALDVNTPIPTPNGFVNMVDLKVGDTVFDENGKKCRVTWKSKIWKDRPTYRLTFSDNSTIICDENHEWLTDTWKSRRSESNAKRNNRNKNRPLAARGTDQTEKRTFATVKTTKEIAETLKAKNDNRNNHSVNLCRSIGIEKRNLLIPPYVLGCWLGDGTSVDGGITTADEEMIERIRLHGYTVNKRSDKYGYGIKGIKSELRKIGVLGNKHIPNDYLFSSHEQRFELLRGLMDTDGHCSKVEARNEYCGVNKRLCEEVYALICSLGIKATFVDGDATLNGQYVSKKYRIFFKTNALIYHLKRKQDVINSYFETRAVRGNDMRYITKCERVEGYETQCISVDSENHLFLAGRQFIPTHNSTYVEWYVLNLINDHNMKASFFSPEHTPMELHQTNFIQKAVGKSFWSSSEASERVSEEDIKRYIDWSKEKIYLTSPEMGESATWDWLLGKFKEQMFSYGVDIFVIDAFNKVQMPSGNRLDAINDILTKLTSFAQVNDAIIFLVAHPTKMKKNDAGEYELPTLYDVSGSADFRNQTHDGFTIYRHFADNPRTSFWNMKTKFKFQGEIGARTDMEYDVPTGRYYEMGQTPPRFDMTIPMDQQTIPETPKYNAMQPSRSFEPSAITESDIDGIDDNDPTDPNVF